jgi:hypothetical protein
MELRNWKSLSIDGDRLRLDEFVEDCGEWKIVNKSFYAEPKQPKQKYERA